MRTNIIETYQETVNQCFSMTLEGIFGAAVKEQLLQLLEQNGIPRSEIGARFDDVVRVLTDVFGTSSRLLIYRTVVNLYEEYSVRPNFGFHDPLRDQLLFLRERVLADIMKPRHLTSIDDSIYISGPRSIG